MPPLFTFSYMNQNSTHKHHVLYESKVKHLLCVALGSFQSELQVRCASAEMRAPHILDEAGRVSSRGAALLQPLISPTGAHCVAAHVSVLDKLACVCACVRCRRITKTGVPATHGSLLIAAYLTDSSDDGRSF